MAAVLPIRPNTNSSGTSTGSGSQRAPQRQPSFSSFPGSGGNRRPGPNSIQNDPQNGYSNMSVPSSARSFQSGPRRPPPSAMTRNQYQKPLKSQYPASSTERHVEYVLVASFDIDRGSIMEHQFPGPVGGDEHEHMLAELMLPDQAHKRDQDWTIFFLHKDAAAENDEDGRKKKDNKRGSQGLGHSEAGTNTGQADSHDTEDSHSRDENGTESDSEDQEPDGPPLIYVLNLVNKEENKSMKRGAEVKSMAICTRHPFLHIYKPLLLLALRQYIFKPSIEKLSELYDAANSMDLSLMPRLTMSERFLLWSSEAKDLFLEKFEVMIAQRMMQKDRNANAGGGLALPSPAASLARGRYGLPRDTHEFESVVKFGNAPIPVKVPTALSPETVGDFSLIKLITTFSTPHATAPLPFSPTHPHLTTSGPSTHPIIVLLNALLTQKRIVFLGHDMPSSEVADAVLGACALASGSLLRGFTRYAFPYTDLSKIDGLLTVPGFIAGVTNPHFANKPEWWDLLCDLPSGRMRISNRIESAPLTEGVAYFQQSSMGMTGPGGGLGAIAAAGASLSAGLGGSIGTNHVSGDATGDIAFMADVLKTIEERHGETALRAKFRRWIVKFTRLASAFEEVVYGASALHAQSVTTSAASPLADFDSHLSFSTSTESPLRHKQSSAAFSTTDQLPPEVTGHGYVWPSPQAKTQELAANATRIEGWRSTRSYYNFIQDITTYFVHRPIKELDLTHLHDKLSKLRLPVEQSMNIYLALCAAVNHDQEIVQLLGTVCNDGQNQGLFYIALGLFHPKLEVREQVAELLHRIQEHDAGRHFWNGLSRFSRMAWERVWNARQARLGRGAGTGDDVLTE